MIYTCSDSENKIILNSLRTYYNVTSDILPLKINGATIHSIRSVGLNKYEIWFVEDDFVDENNNLYVITYPFNLMGEKLSKNDRLITVYGADGSYYILPVDGNTWKLVGVRSDVDVDSIDLMKAKRIPTPSALELSSEISPTEKESLRKIRKLIISNSKQTLRHIIGYTLLVIVIFLLCGLLNIFTVTSISNLTVTKFVIVTVICVIMWIVSSVFLIKLIHNSAASSIENCSYKREFILCRVTRPAHTPSKVFSIEGFINDKGTLIPVHYNVTTYSLYLEGITVLPSKVYLYSTKELPGHNDIVYISNY